MAKVIYTTPEMEYNTLFCEISKQYNTLIAGFVGSGKSVLLHGIIHSIATTNLPIDGENGAVLFLADPKRVELVEWADLPHTQRYACDHEDIIDMMDEVMAEMEWRFTQMQKNRQKKYSGGDLYLIIDELADLMVTQKRAFSSRLTKIMQLGRAAKVHVISATQSPSRKTIPTESQLNYTCQIALHCRTAIESRQIIGVPGAEELPLYGSALVSMNGTIQKYPIEMIEDSELQELRDWWSTEGKGIEHLPV